MASARVEIVQPEPPPRKVILELSEEEAGAIFAILGYVAGTGPVRDATRTAYSELAPLFAGTGSPFVSGSPTLNMDAAIPKLKP